MLNNKDEFYWEEMEFLLILGRVSVMQDGKF